MAYKATFRFRTSVAIVRRASRVRRILKKTKSEFGRDALLAFVEAKEKELVGQLKEAA